ncbi:MAG: aldo/keto reductase [Phycisphaeraceae bacterium]|nr:aldo/keto reductase [Phycisphaeraceae bacterium]
MKTLELGNTGVKVSALCLGTMNFGTRNSKELSYELLDQYVAAGGSFLDTANCYSWWNPPGKGGESESLLGQWLKDRKLQGKMFIATKVGFTYPPVPTSLKPALILQECDKSLNRLGVDAIDLYYAHRDDTDTPQEESLAAFDKLIKAGKIRLIGASNFLAWRMEQARWVSSTRKLANYCCVQQRFTYLRANSNADFSPQRNASSELVEWCALNGLTFLAYSPLLSGAYTRQDRKFSPQYQSPDSDARLAALRSVAHEVSATPNQVIYAWMLAQPSPIIPLMAAGSADQMKENLAAPDVKLTAEQVKRLDDAGVPRR